MEDYVKESKKIQKNTGLTFYLATQAFPKRIRHETYILYAFFRKSDDIVDTRDPIDDQGGKLEEYRQKAVGEMDSDDPVLKGFNKVRESKGIPDSDVKSFIESMKMDIEKDTYESHSELSEYMDGSAAAVGRMMTCIIDPEDEKKAIPHATALGEAFQLTNFIRDVGEDIDKYDRIYLPKQKRQEYDVSDEQIRSKEINQKFRDLIENELRRTTQIYVYGVKGIKYLTEDAQFPVYLAAVLYHKHHNKIRAMDYDVLNETPDLNKRDRILASVKAYYHWKRSDDPLEAFLKSISH